MNYFMKVFLVKGNPTKVDVWSHLNGQGEENTHGCLVLLVAKYTLKKNSATHVIKLAFALKTYPPWQYKYCK